MTLEQNPSPPISLVIPTRGERSAITPVLDAVVPQVEAVHGEIVVVHTDDEPSSDEPPIRWVSMTDPNLLRLRARAVREARGGVIAIGEDHAVPEPGWCEAVLRGHAEHPDADVLVGCLINATAGTVSGRANFLAFAAPYAPPMRELPADRPPPVSTLSFKRRALAALGQRTGSLETDLIPRLYAEGRMVADPRIRVDHYQDHGLIWSVQNLYRVTRAAYGYVPDRESRPGRRQIVGWLVRRAPRQRWRDAQAVAGHGFRAQLDLGAAGLIGVAGSVGGLVGTYAGPGRAPERMS